MAKKPLILPRHSLLFLICSTCAWVGSGAADKPNPVPVNGGEAVGRRARPEPLGRRTPNEDGLHSRPPHAMITPAPLLPRQDQSLQQLQALSDQLQLLSQQSRSVSQASQQLSQSSRQLNQSLEQATQRLSQTEQQLASARACSRAPSSRRHGRCRRRRQMPRAA
ncbi:hypothetical protein VTI74DRAFT_2401 [Chaetomium olivicolor]